VGSKANHLAQAEKLRRRAKECRTLAEIVHESLSAASYLKMADAYETLARDEEAHAAMYR
jgi:hypothetical protein